MPGKPVATVTSMHVCPMVTGVVPHVGGPVIGPGAPNVLINNKPAAIMGDMCTCAGPPDMLVMGNPAVLINGKPVACVGDMTAHGGTITIGEPNVMIGTATLMQSAVMPVKDIPFPKIDSAQKAKAKAAGLAKSLEKAEENMVKIKSMAKSNVENEEEKKPLIYNLQWKKEGSSIGESKEKKKVILSANVDGIDDGNTINFNVTRKDKNGKEEIIQLSGTVNEGTVEVEWEVEELSDNN